MILCYNSWANCTFKIRKRCEVIITADKIKETVAKNIASLRKQANMTQLQLAEALNYSDKAVSKWERGESLPDISALLNMASLFGVSVDYLVSDDNDKTHKKRASYTKKQKRRHVVITALSVMLVWLIATVVFVNINLIIGFAWHGSWLLFVYAGVISFILLLIFNSIWGRRKLNYLIITFLVWSILAAVYLSALSYNIWLIFIIGIPAQIIILLWSRLN